MSDKSLSERFLEAMNTSPENYYALSVAAAECVRALQFAYEWICGHWGVADEWLNEHPDANRHWCGHCHSWVYRRDIVEYKKLCEALERLEGVLK